MNVRLFIVFFKEESSTREQGFEERKKRVRVELSETPVNGIRLVKCFQQLCKLFLIGKHQVKILIRVGIFFLCLNSSLIKFVCVKTVQVRVA